MALLEKLANLNRTARIRPSRRLTPAPDGRSGSEPRAAARPREIIDTYRTGKDFAKAQQEADAAIKKWPDDRTDSH